MKTRHFSLLFAAMLLTSLVFGQEEAKPGKIQKTGNTPTKYKTSWSMGAFGGMPIIFGDVNSEYRSLGYGINIQKGLNNSLAMRLQATKGFALGVDRKYANLNMIQTNPALNGINDPVVDFKTLGYTYWNYRTDYYEGSLQIMYNFTLNDFRLKEFPSTNMYVYAGLGGIMFRTFTDQKDANGNLYNFTPIYNDYVNGVITQDVAKKEVIKLLDRTYETPAEGNPLGTASTFQFILLNHIAVPTATGGFGLRVKLSSRMDLNLDTRLSFINDDHIDGQIWDRTTYGVSKSNDLLWFTSLGLNIRLGKLDNVYWFDNPSAMHYKVTLENKRKIALLTTDTDGDGVSDYFDKDLDTPNGVKVDASGSALDSDNDGIPDWQDKEPFTDKGAQVDSNGVAFDDDLDGVPNHKDLENYTPKGNLVNFQGVTIGEKGSMTGTSGSAIGFLPAIFFDFNDASLKTEFLSPLSMVAAALKSNQNFKLKIVGYTDNVGNQEYNIALGLKRAQTVANYLTMQGISADRLTIESKGAAEPLTDVNSKDANRLNRRVQFELIKGGASSPNNFEEVPSQKPE